MEPYWEWMKYAFLRPPLYHWGKIEKEFDAAMVRIFDERAAVQATLDDLAQRIDWLIAAEQKRGSIALHLLNKGMLRDVRPRQDQLD